MVGFEVFGVETIDRGAGRLNRARQAFIGSPATILRQSGDRVLESLKEAIPVAQEDENWAWHGREHARDRIEFHIRGGDEGTFEGPDYLRYVVGGSDEHQIVPINGLALSFFIGGEQHASNMVTIPARDPNDFRRRAWDDARDDVRAIVREVGMKVVRGEVE